MRARAMAARAGLVVGLLAVVTFTSRPGRAAPLDEPFVGGMSFSGPTSPTLGAVYWNPAAVGLVRGFQLMVAVSGRLSTVDVSRMPINPMTGAPGGSMPTGSAHARDLSGPTAFGPNSYLALSTDFGGDRFTIAFATYMPYVQRINFPLSPTNANNEPTRYHVLSLDLRNLVLVPALSIRFGSDFRIGFAPGFLFSTGHLRFAEDLGLDGGSNDPANLCGGAPCGAENPAAAARYDVSSGNGLGDAKFSVTLGAGLYYRRKSFELGIAYQSRPLGSDVPGVEVAGQHTTVTLPPGDPNGGGQVLSCPNEQSSRCIFGDLSYRLPDVWIAGATWRLGPGLELTGMVRWLRLSVHDRIDVRLSGPGLADHDIPEHVVLYRGFKDVWDTRLRVSYWWRERIRVGAMLRLETSAVDDNAVNAAAVDGFKVQPVGLIEVRLIRQIWLGGGYGVTFMRAVDVTDSAFKPEAATGCAGAGGDLANPDCQARLAGRARPTAAGHYTARTQDFGATLTLKF